jgi:hypothetical protein
MTSLDELLLIVQTLLTFFTKRATEIRRSTVLSYPLQLVFDGVTFVIVEAPGPLFSFLLYFLSNLKMGPIS